MERREKETLKKKEEKRTTKGNGRREKERERNSEGQKKRQKKGKGEWAWMEHAGGSFVRASSAGRSGCCRCNDLENSASGVNVSKPASCGRAHVPSSGAHACARARAISWKRSLARQRRVTMTSEATWTVAACARQTWKVLFFTPLPTRARSRAQHRLIVIRRRPDLLAPDELRGEPAVLSGRVERRIGSSVRYRPVTEKKLGHVSEISLFILFYFIFFLFIAESSNSTLEEREVREFDIACGTVMAAVLKV